MKFNSQQKFYIGIAVLLVALILIYPFISNVGQFTAGSNKLSATSKSTGIVPAALPTPPSINPPVGYDHGSLTGLEDDDHLQYVLVDGSRAMTNTLIINKLGEGLRLVGGLPGAANLAWLTFYGDGGETGYVGDGSPDNGDISLYSDAGPVSIGSQGTFPLTVINNKVGIGTTTPAGKLHVSGGGIISENAGETDLWLKDTSSSQSWLVGTNSVGGMYIYDNSRTGYDGYALVVMKSTGNVGIGTITPFAKLDVNGDIHAENAQLGGLEVIGNLRTINAQIDSGAITGSASKLTYNGIPVSSTYSIGRATCTNTASITGQTGNIIVTSCSPTAVTARCSNGLVLSGGCYATTGLLTINSPGNMGTTTFTDWMCVYNTSTSKTISLQCFQ